MAYIAFLSIFTSLNESRLYSVEPFLICGSFYLICGGAGIIQSNKLIRRPFRLTRDIDYDQRDKQLLPNYIISKKNDSNTLILTVVKKKFKHREKY